MEERILPNENIRSFCLLKLLDITKVYSLNLIKKYNEEGF